MAVSGELGATEGWEALGGVSCSTSSIGKEEGFNRGVLRHPLSEDGPLDRVLSFVVVIASEDCEDVLAFSVCSFAARIGALGGSSDTFCDGVQMGANCAALHVSVYLI